MTGTPTITEAELARLRELAEAATAQTTGNRWLPDVGGIVLDPDRPGNGWDGTIICEVPSTERPERRRAIRDYLVELDPQTIIALLDAVKAQTEPPAEADEPLKCGQGVGGTVPSWAGSDQIDRCRCVRPSGHDGPCACSHNDPPDAVSPKKGQD